MIGVEAMKVCSRCGQAKPIDVFVKRRDSGRRTPECRECKRDRTRSQFIRDRTRRELMIAGRASSRSRDRHKWDVAFDGSARDLRVSRILSCACGETIHPRDYKGITGGPLIFGFVK